MKRSRTARHAAARSVLCAFAVAVAVAVAACIDGEPGVRPDVPAGEVGQGRELVYGYTCGECHVIPGIAEASGLVGPPLTDWVERRYIAGAVENTPVNLIRFLMSPQEIEPGTAMPDLGITEPEARHIAAYLYSLGNTDGLGPPHPFPVEWLHRLKTTFGSGQSGGS